MTYQHHTRNHESFEYNSEEQKIYLKPEEKKEDADIKGIELEISDNNYRRAEELLDKVIDRNIVCAYDTMHDYKRKYANCIWTYDGTVEQGELVIQAERPRNLALKMKMLNKFLNPDTIKNNSGTSVHVHMNKQYLTNLGISDLDMIKAGEAVCSTLHSISGRQNLAELNRWVKTRIETSYTMPIALRCKYIDALTINDYRDYDKDPGHYMMVNVQNEHTTEIRMFSNFYNFDYDRTKLFLESCDMIANIALEMQNLSYKDNYEIVIDIVKDFYESNRRRRKYLKEIRDTIISDKNEIKLYEARELIKEINNQFARIEHFRSAVQPLEVLRLLRNIEDEHNIIYNGVVNLNEVNINNIQREIEAQILRQ